jgi:hypothetical protein
LILYGIAVTGSSFTTSYRIDPARRRIQVSSCLLFFFYMESRLRSMSAAIITAR